MYAIISIALWTFVPDVPKGKQLIGEENNNCLFVFGNGLGT